MNPIIEKAYAIGPTLTRFEKGGKYLLIVIVFIFMIYLSMDEMSGLTGKLKKEFGDNAEDDDWEDEESSSWLFNMYLTIIKDNFSMEALKDIGFYMALFVFSLVGYGILSRSNYNYALKLEEERQRIEEEKLKKAKENKNKSKFKPQTNIDKKND